MSHTYDSAGSKTATLTVNYADGDSATQDRRRGRRADAAVHQRQRRTSAPTCRSCSSLTLGTPATFGAFTPSVDKDYTASTTASRAGHQRRRAR